MTLHSVHHKPAYLAIALIVVSLFTLMGCGQKGPLYLPQAKQPNPAPDATQTAPATEKSAAETPKP